MEEIATLHTNIDTNIDSTFAPGSSSTKRFSLHPNELALQDPNINHFNQSGIKQIKRIQ